MSYFYTVVDKRQLFRQGSLLASYDLRRFRLLGTIDKKHRPMQVLFVSQKCRSVKFSPKSPLIFTPHRTKILYKFFFQSSCRKSYQKVFLFGFVRPSRGQLFIGENQAAGKPNLRSSVIGNTPLTQSSLCARASILRISPLCAQNLTYKI